MRQLKPLTILALGALLTGVAMAVPFLMIEHDARNFRGAGIGFSVGAAFGLLMFAPIALAEKFRASIRAWLERNGSQIYRLATYTMALALGYWIASIRYQMLDAVALMAMGLVFLGALFGVVIGVVKAERRSAK
jgi:hypothetical protein